MERDVQFWSLLAGVFVPIVTGIVTTKWAASALKSTVTAVLAVVAGAVSYAAANSGDFQFYECGIAVLEAAAVAWASYNGFWKPTGAAPAVQDNTANFGLGKGAPPGD